MQSLMSMEFIHRQEELEHAELERALMLSLAIEEERLRLLIADAKIEAAMSDFDSESEQSRLRITAAAADSKVSMIVMLVVADGHNNSQIFFIRRLIALRVRRLQGHHSRGEGELES
jgi:hypothetical protein